MKKFIFCFIFCASIALRIFSLNIVFDLGGVLFNVSATKIFYQHLGIKNILLYCINNRKIPSGLKQTFFETLDAHYPYPNQIKFAPSMHENSNLPYLLHQNLVGELNAQTALSNAYSAIEKSYYKNKFEKFLLNKIAEVTFDPTKFSSYTLPITQGFKLIKECHNSGHSIYILSNWAKESFEIIYKKYPEIFSLCNGIVISGYEGTAKPNPKIFQILLNRFDLTAKETIFIDDQTENIYAAESLGITAILCDNFKNVIQKLKNLSVI